MSLARSSLNVFHVNRATVLVPLSEPGKIGPSISFLLTQDCLPLGVHVGIGYLHAGLFVLGGEVRPDCGLAALVGQLAGEGGRSTGVISRGAAVGDVALRRVVIWGRKLVIQEF